MGSVRRQALRICTAIAALVYTRCIGPITLAAHDMAVLHLLADTPASSDHLVEIVEYSRSELTDRGFRGKQPAVKQDDETYRCSCISPVLGEAIESELIDGIYSEDPAGYETTDEWWQTFMQDTLAGMPEFEERTEDGRAENRFPLGFSHGDSMPDHDSIYNINYVDIRDDPIVSGNSVAERILFLST